MKRYITLMIILFPVLLWAQKNKKFDKLIEKYDVIEYVEGIDNNKPELFWDAVWRNNQSLLKLYDACEKKKKSAIEAKKLIGYAGLASRQYYDQLYVIDEARNMTASLKKYLYNNDEELLIKRLDVIHDINPNAFTTPDGQIFVTDSLVFLLDFSKNMLLGVCAHEMTHFILQHSLSIAFETQKKLQKNKIAAGIASGVSAAANAYAQANGAVGSDSWNDVETTIETLFESAYNDASRFKYKYSREQEIEADIIAFRFLEWIGVGGEYYINALKLIGTDNDKYFNKQSDHPTIKMRIQLLEYLSNLD